MKTSVSLILAGILLLSCSSLLVQPAASLDFTGRYRMYNSTNFDEFLKAIGIGYFQRMAANRVVPEYIITKRGDDSYTLRTKTSLSDSSITFKDGVEFKENRLDGVSMKSVVKIDGNKWIQTQYANPQVTVVREWINDGNEIVTTSTAKNVVAVRKYKKMAKK